MLLLLALLALAAPGSFESRDAPGLRPIEVVPEVAAPLVILAGGTVMTANGQVFEPGWVAFEQGRINGIGAGPAPSMEGAHVIDVTGRFVTPGLIDTHSHLGVYPSPGAPSHSDGNEATSPTSPEVWAEHSVWPQDPGFQRAMAGGVTTLQVLPGSANLIGGRGVTLHLVPTRGSRAMRFPGAPETLKMACGENPKRVYEASGPSTRMGNVAGQRQAFYDARAYRSGWHTYEREAQTYEQDRAAHEAAVSKREKAENPDPGEPPTPPATDLALETLAGVLEGSVLPQVHCYRADDMLSMLQIADEHGFQVRSFHHAVEAYKIRDILAERQISVSTWADWWGFKMESYDAIPYNLGLVHDAGARAVVHSDSSIGIQRLNQEAAKGLRSGREAGLALSEEDALRWITANAAWTLGIEDEVGTLETGKRADVVVWSAHPLSVYASADLVFVDGLLRFDRQRPQVWSDFQVGQEVAP